MSGHRKVERLALWRAAREAEPSGLDRVQAAAITGTDGQVLSDLLFSMVKAAYLLRIGSTGASRWRIGNRVPAGEELAPAPLPPAPPPAAPQAATDDDDTDVLFSRREAVKGVPAGVPNSVFQLGAVLNSTEPRAEEAETTPPPAPASAPFADLSTWRPAKPLQAAAELWRR